MNKELNSIGLNKKPSDTKVVVAMSGGVDSSTVAGMMKKEGYDVIGITLKLYDDAKQSQSQSNVVLVKISWMQKELLKNWI